MGIQGFCDQTTDGGGWTVFQRRADGSTNFFRDWYNYKVGFGDLTNEFWLGNENLFTLSLQALHPHRSELRIELETFSGQRKFVKYSNFQLGDEHTRYMLHISGFSGNTRDNLKRHNRQEFSTYDKDYDTASSTNCAVARKGAWWFKDCSDSGLNGKYYYYKEKAVFAAGIFWKPLTSVYDSLKFAEM